MKVILSGKNIGLTDALKNMVEKKITKLEKYFDPQVEAQITLSVEKNRQIVEVNIPFSGVVLRAEEENEDMYASIDLVIEKLERQIKKQKTRLQRRNHDSDSLRFEYIPETVEPEDKAEGQIVKTKRFAMKPMSSEEAVLQMELLGHDFFVYQDSESEEVNVVYKRKDGNYGLIEPQY